MISKARAEAFALILRQAHAIEAPVWRDISSVEEKKATKGREKQDKKELKRREKEAKKAMKEARKRGEAPAAVSADAGEWEMKSWRMRTGIQRSSLSCAGTGSLGSTGR
jgi:hypothetical protein